MPNLGELTEIVNSTELTLEVGMDRYILLRDLNLHIGRVETRAPTTDGVAYVFGRGDNWFTATLLVTTPELDSLNTLTAISATGTLTSTAWKIVANNVSGSAKTFAATGVLRDYDVRAGADDIAEIDIFVRITGDNISVS